MSWDESLFRAVNGLAGRSGVLDWLALTLSSPDLLWAPGILLGLYWLWLAPREAFIAGPVLGGLIGLVDFIGAQVKHLVARPRPCMSIADFHQIEACGKTFGFPSNHAVNTAAAAAFLQVLYPGSGWIAWPLVVAIGLARVFIGAHYVTDILGGWFLGALFGGTAAWLLLQWPRFRQPVPGVAPSTQAKSSAP
ncbi:putative Undecaprenyl-diphosphatase [Nitrospira sp. KM1]|uniref:phosphatase PAP2 family protein n=1 Tax=Nitrospira sp. KM1 TaxID=1936990 RepID=UPI0013A743D7|nr:phosphatase PAP2 family protein [Nitrospira sp. KM1]BCA54175.1 putative Undecaprenyl-diphosphatase [Nitrospira sp. KM1]